MIALATAQKDLDIQEYTDPERDPIRDIRPDWNKRGAASRSAA